MSEIEDVLRDAGYEIVDVPRPTVHIGCVHCGRDVEAIMGVCIQCAAKDAPTHWPALSHTEATKGDETDG